jgi:hypothetical protein
MSKKIFDFCFVLFGNDHSTPCVDDGGQSTYELVCEHCASFAEVVSALSSDPWWLATPSGWPPHPKSPTQFGVAIFSTTTIIFATEYT